MRGVIIKGKREFALNKLFNLLVVVGLFLAKHITKGDTIMKKVLASFTLITLLFSLCACSNVAIRGSVVKVTSDGSAELDIMPQKLLEKINIGDIVVVTVGDFMSEMLFVDKIIEEDGQLQLLLDRNNWSICICIYGGAFCEKYDIDVGERATIDKK